ncbi:hypothetical protein FPV67DRAFT_1410605 [Lyophyllum atratum]|nr:hypothetical protein FPV67DRAFT_1410605 [Lyophyllum atratum]
MQEIASQLSVFTGISVIANRLTPSHVDHRSSRCWYDSLASVGPFSTAYLDFPDIRLRLSYDPCTVVNLCGNTSKHEVMDWSGGERVCMVHYLRSDVLDFLGFGESGRVRQSDFEARHRIPGFCV